MYNKNQFVAFKMLYKYNIDTNVLSVMYNCYSNIYLNNIATHTCHELLEFLS